MATKITPNNTQRMSAAAAASYMPAYQQRYAAFIEAYKGACAHARIKESISNYELVGLCQQLDAFANYHSFCESSNKLGSLGAIPQIALDVITASQASSILPLLASTQPMQEESGIVYYRNLHAMTAGGGINKNDKLVSPIGLDKVGDGTWGSQRKKVVLAQTAAGTQTYNGNLGTNTPIRPYRVELAVHFPTANTTMFGRDDGQGNIIGFGLDGHVDYETGVWTIDFKTAPTEVANIECIYDIDVDAAKEIDTLQAVLESKPIKAEIWALKSDIGSFTSYAFNNRFGASALAEVANDLTDEITRIMNARAVYEIYNNLRPDVVEWSRTAPAGVSYAEHRN